MQESWNFWSCVWKDSDKFLCTDETACMLYAVCTWNYTLIKKQQSGGKYLSKYENQEFEEILGIQKEWMLGLCTCTCVCIFMRCTCTCSCGMDILKCQIDTLGWRVHIPFICSQPFLCGGLLDCRFSQILWIQDNSKPPHMTEFSYFVRNNNNKSQVSRFLCSDFRKIPFVCSD